MGSRKKLLVQWRRQMLRWPTSALLATSVSADAEPLASPIATVAMPPFQNIELDLNFLSEEKTPTQLMLTEKKRDMISALKKTWGKWLMENYPGQFSSPAIPKKLRVELEIKILGRSSMEQVETSGYYSLEDEAGEGQLARGEMKQGPLRLSQSSSQSIESQVATLIYNLGLKSFRQWEGDASVAVEASYELNIVGEVGPGAVSALSSHLATKLGDKAKIRPTQWGSDKVHVLVEGVPRELLISELKALNQVVLSGKYRPVFIQEGTQLIIRISKPL